MISVYVGNLPYDTTEADVVELFQQFGSVDRATLVTDRETGRPRGFGFVEMPNDNEARKAIESLSGKDFQGRPLTVNEARNRSAQRNAANLSRSAQKTDNADNAQAGNPSADDDEAEIPQAHSSQAAQDDTASASADSLNGTESTEQATPAEDSSRGYRNDMGKS